MKNTHLFNTFTSTHSFIDKRVVLKLGEAAQNIYDKSETSSKRIVSPDELRAILKERNKDKAKVGTTVHQSLNALQAQTVQDIDSHGLRYGKLGKASLMVAPTFANYEDIDELNKDIGSLGFAKHMFTILPSVEKVADKTLIQNTYISEVVNGQFLRVLTAQQRTIVGNDYDGLVTGTPNAFRNVINKMQMNGCDPNDFSCDKWFKLFLS